MALRRRILVVEDNLINRTMLREILSPQYIVLEAENGQAALELLAAGGEEISLILLDLVMPVMDGLTFLERQRALPELAAIPVIVTTQSGSESSEVAALAHGATDFVPKPYKPQIILHRVNNIIRLRETAAMVNRLQHDPLTGVYNKAFFIGRVTETLRARPETEFDILASDIDSFKLINDVLGAAVGDGLLREMAAACRAIVGERGFCGRFGADRFVCLVERGMPYSDELFRRADERVNAAAGTKNVATKWGVYEIGDRALPVEKMCDWAVLAARSIKGSYQKHYAVYGEALRSRLLREQAITAGMETALAEAQFEVYLQPKYRLRDGALAGAEALVRWRHPEWGLLPPAEFIPLFERNGFISRLDRYVWDRSCALQRRWRDMGLPALPVSVNVSRADVYQADLVEALTRMVEGYGLRRSDLHLEITESAYTEDPEQIISSVEQLHDLGFVIEMDDFGSGYSSLNMLDQMKLDVLKLDMAFIRSEMAKPPGQGILRFIMQLARGMGLEVVAEGVETAEQAERLRALGCDYAQGYYFARPMDSAGYEALLRGRREKNKAPRACGSWAV